MELTPKNSPKYDIAAIKRQNAKWRKEVFNNAAEMKLEELEVLVHKTETVIDNTQNIAVALTEKERLKILTEVLEMKKLMRERKR